MFKKKNIEQFLHEFSSVLDAFIYFSYFPLTVSFIHFISTNLNSLCNNVIYIYIISPKFKIDRFTSVTVL